MDITIQTDCRHDRIPFTSCNTGTQLLPHGEILATDDGQALQVVLPGRRALRD
jgi:hypothetical protein